MDNPIASDKIKIKKEMFSYQLRIANFYNIHICTVKELIPNFLTKKNVFMKTCLKQVRLKLE